MAVTTCQTFDALLVAQEYYSAVTQYMLDSEGGPQPYGSARLPPYAGGVLLPNLRTTGSI